MRYLVNNNGAPFDSAELQILRSKLDSLTDDKRIKYRNQNASAIAQHDAVKFLIISGPGTGKSYLFLNRIKYWYQQDTRAKVFVISFVRKLVADLQNDIDNNERLTDIQKKNIVASTLHKFARRIVEQNHGTTEWRFQQHFRIIGQLWKNVVWSDVLAFNSGLNKDNYSWKRFEERLHNDDFDKSNKWWDLKYVYFRLCQFYNAVGFADLILRAKDALAENHKLNESGYFIIDEYQDFNSAEDALINQLVNKPKGLLIAGDDEQVLYEKSRSGKPILIRKLYKNNDYANGMLPFCSRSKENFYITKSADFFINQHRDDDCIEKVYLPIKTTTNYPKIQIIACSSPNSAVDYIEKFVTDNRAEIDERKTKLANGEEKDAFLLILTPRKIEKFFVNSRFDGKEKIESLIFEYQGENRYFSEDYYKILSYYSLANNSQNNFTFRKVLYYKKIKKARTFELIKIAMQNGQNFCDLNTRETKDVIQECKEIKTILEADNQTIDKKIENITCRISITDQGQLKKDMEQKSIKQKEVIEIEHQEEEKAELEEIEGKKMGAIELMTIIGSKGLSADHVIIIGFDNVNMGSWITKNAFYVAMTRARRSLHILTALKSGGAMQSHNFLEQLPDEYTEYFSYKKGDHTKSPLKGKQGFKDYLSYQNSISRGR